MPSSKLVGVEVNTVACGQLEGHGFTAHNSAFLDVPLTQQYPLVITRGFLMHVPSAALQATLAKIYNASSKWICLVEYYSPVRREISSYHGQSSALWLDDFAGKIMTMYPDLKLNDYGFKYHQDNNGNDLTYFLLEK
jgi:spore coat polysaccharide biosynthesis protein SpsF